MIQTKPRILECHSLGDIRFSALYAEVRVHDEQNTIEHFYQMAKRFTRPPYQEKNWLAAKRRGARDDLRGFEIFGTLFPFPMGEQWYKLLWVRYFDHHPHLLQLAQGYDDFHDLFARPGHLNQAEVIRRFVKDGRAAIMADCQELTLALRGMKQ